MDNTAKCSSPKSLSGVSARLLANATNAPMTGLSSRTFWGHLLHYYQKNVLVERHSDFADTNRYSFDLHVTNSPCREIRHNKLLTFDGDDHGLVRRSPGDFLTKDWTSLALTMPIWKSNKQKKKVAHKRVISGWERVVPNASDPSTVMAWCQVVMQRYIPVDGKKQRASSTTRTVPLCSNLGDTR